MGRSHEIPGGSSPHDGSYRITNCTDGIPSEITPAQAMEIFKKSPQEVFPFPIDGKDGEDEIEVGREFDLRPLFLDDEQVTVTAETPNSFTFIAEDDHLRGENASLTFTTFRNDEGDFCLEQTATFRKNFMTPVLDFGSRIMWKLQTMRLERALKKKKN